MKLIILLFLLSACEIPILENEKLSVTPPANYEGEIWGSHTQRWFNLKWQSGPYGDPTHESVFELSIFDQAGLPTDLPAGFSFLHYGWMPDMGHGTADDGLLIWQELGLWQSSELRFNMPGRWQLIFEIYDEGQKVEEIFFDFIF